MKKIHLSQAEKAKFEHLHSIKRDGKERYRLKAILLASEGWNEGMIAQALRIHEKTVGRYLEDFGAGKLKNESGGDRGYLTEAQTQELIEYLSENTAMYNSEIVVIVKEKFGEEFSIPGMNKWLHHHGFSYKKYKGVPHKADKQLQEEFTIKPQI